MLLRLAALAALAAAPCLAAAQSAPMFVRASAQTLTLDDAFARVADAHPDLRMFDGQRAVFDAEREVAALRPPLEAGIGIENLGPDAPARTLETTLTLAGVFERGGKPDARRALAQTRIDALALQRETARVDLLAETARRHLAIVVATRRLEIAQADVAHRTRFVAAARQRFAAGASPEAVVLTAQAAQAQAELQVASARLEIDTAQRSLSMLWGDPEAGFAIADSDPLALPDIADFDTLRTLLARSPELLQFNDKARIAEARLQLARSDATPDIGWQAGIRHQRETGDTSLVGGFVVPLGSRARAQPAIRAASAELALVSIERDAGDRALQATLAEAHGRYRVAQSTVSLLARDVLPRLGRAAGAIERAWRAGAVSYLEWSQLQDARSDALRQQLDAAEAAQIALIELQRLTGQPLVVAHATPAPFEGDAR
ncbi:Cation transporter [Luteimonas sp. 9C]|uniref:TolC family protein n=1 Tax=Luteimonas sp. 9C TaxID=2653148 RepID=UPI0012EF2C00|nr:TolC family protein [Luteimonas sp. 9C]VXB19140.1 Cation transporter [Luteimonas sp. 9C]